jgi:hypothetical protein
MQPPFVFNPFRTDRCWYDAYWLTPAPPDRPARTGRVRWIVGFLFPVRLRSQDSRPRPVAGDDPAHQSLICNG